MDCYPVPAYVICKEVGLLFDSICSTEEDAYSIKFCATTVL